MTRPCGGGTVETMSNGDVSLIQMVWDAMSRSVDFSSGRLTDVQLNGILHAIASLIGRPPDALVGFHANQGDVGDVQYTFYWVSGQAFGRLEVLRPADTESGAPPTRAWVRPLSNVTQIDVDFDITSHPVVRSDIFVKMKIGMHWVEGGEPEVVLDGTGSMPSHARPELEKMIRLVLDKVSESSRHE